MKNKFEERYNTLNAEQREAVDTIDGPVMVVAGPGTGKTQILTLRIANILAKTDTEPENILALTFTESGVQAMRKRLADIIGQTAYRVGIYTFHSFSHEIIRLYPEYFPLIVGSEPVTEVEQIQIIEDLIVSSDNLEYLKPFGDSLYYAKTVLSRISDLKREGVTALDFERIVISAEDAFSMRDDVYHEKGAHKGKMRGEAKDEQKQIAKNRELLHLYQGYQEKIHSLRKYDFNDMIVEVLSALRSEPDLLLTLQEKRHYILVDEHQDTNNAQNKILELLANFHDNPNLFVVGDEKQSIYRFQGASLENFFYFKHLYPQAKLVTLKHNYRSSQTILDSAHSLLPGESALVSSGGVSSRPISLAKLKTKQQELVWIAEQINLLLKDEVPAHEIAVLYRNNAHAFLIADVFAKHDIPYRIESDTSLFEDKDARRFITLMRAVASPLSNEHIGELLFMDFFDIHPLSASKVMRSASQKRVVSLVEFLSHKSELEALGCNKDEIETIYTLGVNLATWKRSSMEAPLVSMLEALFRESGLLQSMMQNHDGTSRLQSVNRLFEEARSFQASYTHARLADFVEYIDRLMRHGIMIKGRISDTSSSSVRLMTAHKSKGLEFDYVYIVGVNDGVWGNKISRETLPLLPAVYSLFETVPADLAVLQEAGEKSEERRVLYVALTRARKHVTLSYVEQREDGKEILPSEFIGEIKTEFISFEDTQAFEAGWLEKQMVLFNKEVNSTVSETEYKEQMKAFVREKLFSQGLSVTALNNYLASPWLFFFRNLVRLPSASNRNALFGNAVHSALRSFFDKARDEQYPTLPELLQFFVSALDKEPYHHEDYRDLREKGEAVLEKWFNEYAGTWNLDTRTEFRISNVVLPSEHEDDLPRLIGVLDKMEFTNPEHTRVVVVDYKTGKPKTLGQVKGETKDSDGNYYRQLVYYKLLLRYFQGGKLHMEKAVLEFVEPDDTGRFRRYEFVIEDEEVDQLEEEIRRVVSEILDLAFWDMPVDEKSEEYRHLVDAVCHPRKS